MTLPGSRRSAWAGAGGASPSGRRPVAVPARAQVCAGDCSGDGEVRVGDIVLAVNIVLGLAPVDACPSLGTPPIGIAQVIASIANALAPVSPVRRRRRQRRRPPPPRRRARRPRRRRRRRSSRTGRRTR
ncbi:MAG: hypothetical protein U0802_16590 [Candidatus Binatia bacterium]